MRLSSKTAKILLVIFLLVTIALTGGVLLTRSNAKTKNIIPIAKQNPKEVEETKNTLSQSSSKKAARSTTNNAINTNNETTNYKGSKEMTESEMSVERYNALVAELDADLAAYRTSMPVFAKFSDVCINRVVPLAIEGEKAGIWLSEANKRGEHNYDRSNYDKEKTNQIRMKIMATLYKEIYAEFQKAMEAGQLTMPNKQEEIYFNGCSHYFQTIEELLPEPFEKHYPYEKDTLEYNYFVRELGQFATMATSPLGKMVMQIPPELEEKQRIINDLQAQLFQVPEKYKESFIKKLEDASSKIGRISEFNKEVRSLERQSLDDSLDNLD